MYANQVSTKSPRGFHMRYAYPDHQSRLGNTLTREEQREVLATYVHRHTAEHVPVWARKPREDGSAHPVQFASDREWLANTWFVVTKTGKLYRGSSMCYSQPTWPNGGGLASKPGVGSHNGGAA